MYDQEFVQCKPSIFFSLQEKNAANNSNKTGISIIVAVIMVMFIIVVGNSGCIPY